MSIVGEFVIPTEEFVLNEVLTENDGVTVDLERVVPTRTGTIPFFWAWGDGLDSLGTNTREIRHLKSLEEVVRFDDGTLYRAEWDEDGFDGFLRALNETGATILEGVGNHENWVLELRFKDHDALSRFQDYCNQHNLKFRVNRLYSMQQLEQEKHQDYGLTPEQREILVTAYSEGYFEQPRRADLNQLGNHFDISGSAVSGRIRRGLKKLLEHTLVE